MGLDPCLRKNSVRSLLCIGAYFEKLVETVGAFFL